MMKKKPERWTDRIRFTEDKKPETLWVEMPYEKGSIDDLWCDKCKDVKRRKAILLAVGVGEEFSVQLCVNCFNKLRAAQPKASDLIFIKAEAFIRGQQAGYEVGKAEGIAQGKKDGYNVALNDFEFFAVDVELADNVYDAHNSIDNWILNKRAEAQKQEWTK
jgi:flagellar biosynthesis/type III secretory pathway protein FliH